MSNLWNKNALWRKSFWAAAVMFFCFFLSNLLCFCKTALILPLTRSSDNCIQIQQLFWRILKFFFSVSRHTHCVLLSLIISRISIKKKPTTTMQCLCFMKCMKKSCCWEKTKEKEDFCRGQQLWSAGGRLWSWVSQHASMETFSQCTLLKPHRYCKTKAVTCLTLKHIFTPHCMFWKSHHFRLVFFFNFLIFSKFIKRKNSLQFLRRFLKLTNGKWGEISGPKGKQNKTKQ